MGYVKQNFVNGQVLTASQLNHMEDGIAATDNTVRYDVTQYLTPEQQQRVKNNIGANILLASFDETDSGFMFRPVFSAIADYNAAGKLVFAKYGDRLLSLVSLNENQAVFQSMDNIDAVSFVVNTSNVATKYEHAYATSEELVELAPLYVTMTGVDATGYTTSHTYAQIKAAYDAGRAVYCVYSTTIMVLAAVTASMVAFQTVYSSGTYRRAFVYADVSKSPKTDTMKLALATDLAELSPLYVTMTGDETSGYAVDYTYEQIKAAYDAGRSVYCVHATTIMTLGGVTPSLVAFSVTFNNTYRRVFIYADANKPPKYETMTFALADDLAGKADAPVATDEIYFDITDEGIISLKSEYQKIGKQSKDLPEDIIIPDSLNGVAVTALAPAMFNGNKRVKRITLPSCIDAIPEAFCNAAWNLEEVRNTENIKYLGSHAFAKSGLRKAYFPNLIGFPLRSNGNAATSHFSGCAFLVVADLGQVFAQPGAAIPPYCFNGCERLAYLRNAGGVTSIGAFGLFMTRRIANPDFLPSEANIPCELTSIGDYGLLLSRADYDWDNLTGCTFGTLSTSNDINTTDYSGCNFTSCNIPMRSTFEQHDPRWANKNIGNCANTYSTGCATVAAAMIYSALMKVDMESPEEFVAAVGAVDESLLDLDIADGANNTTGGGDFWGELVRWFDAVGLNAVVYNSVSVENVQTMYDSLAAGALVWGRILADHGDENHCVVFHGVNSKGELLVVDSSAASREIGVYEAATYTMPIQNFMRDHGDVDHFIVVTKK